MKKFIVTFCHTVQVKEYFDIEVVTDREEEAIKRANSEVAMKIQGGREADRTSYDYENVAMVSVEKIEGES